MSDSDNGDERPRKRRALGNDSGTDALGVLVNEELQLELGLRTRLEEFVESRLTWACLLHDALEKHFDGSASTSSSFSEPACDAYHAIHNKIKFIFDDNPPSPAGIAVPPAIAPEIPVENNPRTRTRHHLNNGIGFQRDSNKYLYIRDTHTSPYVLYKLACPDCGRSDFPKLQGLLNHCRIKHKREYGSHDECIQQCAVAVSEDEREDVLDFGIEITSMGAGLRRIFEMAVGADSGIISRPALQPVQNITRPSEEVSGSTMLTKSLGHHKDSPALAPFLGRKVKERRINASDTDATIDIFAGMNDWQPRGARPWRMSYQHRSAVKEDDVDTEEEMIGDSSDTISQDMQSTKHGHASSRFHVKARLIVSDWSLRLPRKSPTSENHQATHKWMVEARAPSYSLHASSILKSMIVSSVSSPSPTSLQQPISVSEPPFAVMGFADVPFLARITFEWAGSSNRPTEIEHWVELDGRESARPIMGNEYFLDIELDRNTPLVPRVSDVWTPDWGLGTLSSNWKDARKRESEKTADPSDEVVRMRSLLQQYPMTRKDSTSRTTPRLSYFLPLSSFHFRQLPLGRRKAIEFGRAKALWEAFVLESSKDEKISDVSIFKSPVDVWRWLEKEGEIPRLPAVVQKASEVVPSLQNETGGVKGDESSFCSMCGLGVNAHARSKKHEPPGFCKPSSDVLKPAYLDTTTVFYYRRPTEGIAFDGPSFQKFDYDPGLLLVSVDPRLTSAVQEVVRTLRLSCQNADRRARVTGPDNGEIERELAPFAMLSLATKVFLRHLVRDGLRVAGKQRLAVPQARTKDPGVDGKRKQVLTPAHILHGLVDGMGSRGTFLRPLGVKEGKAEDVELDTKLTE